MNDALLNRGRDLGLTKADWFTYGVLFLILLCTLWCNSGTLSPYAATLRGPWVVQPCEYLYNYDHLTFFGTFQFVDGAPREAWEKSVVLRRMLYPLIAYPAMKIWGFEVGGFVTNLLLHSLTCIGFVWCIARRFGHSAGKVVGALLVTCPAIAYWGGLPYSYAWIVPSSLISAMLLMWVDAVPSMRRILLGAVWLGILSIGYELLPFFGVALLFVSLTHKRVLSALLAIPAMAAPFALSNYILASIYSVPFFNSNSVSYKNILMSFLKIDDYWSWILAQHDVPWILYRNFLDSNFTILPLLFVVLLVLNVAIRPRVFPSRVECGIFVSVGAVCIFNNVAPPYEGWQLRGVNIARLYQPVFVAFLLYIARVFAQNPQGSLRSGLHFACSMVAVALQGLVVFGPLVKLPYVPDLYLKFYHHADTSQFYYENLEFFGIRPVGFCGKTPPPEKKKKKKKKKKHAPA